MSLTLTHRPLIFVADVPPQPYPIASYLNAGKNTTKFTFQRKDQNIVAITNASGFVSIQVLNDPQITHGAIVGTSIYIKTSKYDTSGTITSFTDALNFVTDIVYESADTGGYINYAKKNYEVQAQVYYGNFNIYLSDLTLSGVPSPQGFADIDLTEILKYLTTKEFTNNYTGVATQDLNSNSFFWIRHREVWKDYEGSWIEFQLPYQYINGVLQPIRANDNIMELWDCGYTNDCKFLTDFAEPEMYVGLPFSISFYQNLLGFNNTTQVFAVVKNVLDINKDEVTGFKGYISTTSHGFLQHINLTATAKGYLEVYILNENIADCEDNCYVEPDYVECGYVGCETEF